MSKDRQLTDAEVNAIREDKADPMEGPESMANILGVSMETVLKVANGETYQQVPKATNPNSQSDSSGHLSESGGYLTP